MGGMEDYSGPEIALPKTGREGALEAVKMGALAFESTRFLVCEDIVIYPDDSATVFRSDFLDAQARDTDWDLQYGGVLRRPSGFLLRKTVECDPEDIQKGDRLILRRKGVELLAPKVNRQRDAAYYSKEIYGRWVH